MTTRPSKFRVHFHKQAGGWTVHYKGQCIQAKEVEIHAKVITVFKPDKKDSPRAWLSGTGTVRQNVTGTVTIW